MCVQLYYYDIIDIIILFALQLLCNGCQLTAANLKSQVFGGILGNVIENEDGSYGSDDRTSEIRLGS